MLSEPNISYKPFWGICRPLNSWRANSPNPIQIYCAIIFAYSIASSVKPDLENAIKLYFYIQEKTFSVIR